MSDIRCINCNLRVTRMRRHALSDQSEQLINTIRLWTYPRSITPGDHICHACWELANYNDSQPSTSTKQIGHRHVCVVCGRSVINISRRRIIADEVNEQRQRVVAVITDWIKPRVLTPESDACVPCWLRAQRESRRTDLDEQVDLDDDIADGRCCVCGIILTLQMRPQPCSNERQILEIIHHRIVNREIPSVEEVCLTCWEQAQQELAQQEIQAQPRSHEARMPLHDNTQCLVLPNIRRSLETGRHCIFSDCTGSERNRIPENIRKYVLRNFSYFITQNARICTQHLENNEFSGLYVSEYSLDIFNATQIEEIIFILMESLTNVNYENIQNYPEHQVKYFVGITKEQHQEIINETPSLRQMHRGSFALTVLLCKLRTGDSGDRLSCLFQVPRRTLETLMSVARMHLIREYVPQHLGFSHISREQVAAKNSIIADGIYGEPDAPPEQKPAIVIADATYLYTQKSSNYLFQKETYSLHKFRNLVKPFILCCCNGYIIDIRGPYTATTNDATIMRELLNEEDFNSFFEDDDIFILDRGFRDVMDSIHDKGYIGHMPETMRGGQSQLTTLEGNRSRCVTINRWVVEAVNGRFKRDFKIFRHEYFNRACPNIMKDFKIAAALLNAYSTQFVDGINAEQFVQRIHDRLFLTNSIALIVEEHNLNRRGALFTPIDGSTMTFPRLSMQDLILFACGIYQIRQARSYVGEHFRFHGIYVLEVCRVEARGSLDLEGVNPALLRARIKSRHTSRKTYFVFIIYEQNIDGVEAILSYCCNCIVGLRTVGCCSHVMSILWYLGFARHEGHTRPAAFLDDILLRVID